MIHVLLEPDDVRLGPAERCCFCRNPTRTWTALPSRCPGEQVACCRRCAQNAFPVQVPSKRAWIDLERAREWATSGPRDEYERRTETWRRVEGGWLRRRRHAAMLRRHAPGKDVWRESTGVRNFSPHAPITK